jgi:ceramide glucosyltransferase
MAWLIGAALVLCTSWTVFGLLATWSWLKRPRPRPAAVHEPSVSVLKPLCGADADLERNLTTFFIQDYRNYEIVFGVEREDDPALAIVERLRSLHPDVSCTVRVGAGSTATNPKIRNIRNMLEVARHDLLLISDSNIRAPRDYLREAVHTLVESDDVGLVTNLFAGSDEDTLGGALENVQLNGFCAAGAALPNLLGDYVVIGKSMLFSRSRFETLGGFAPLEHLLAEDFVMGKMFQHGGYRVRLSRSVLENVTRGMTVRAFLSRQQRWSMLRWRLRPLAAALEPLTSPLFLLPAAFAVFGGWTVAWALSVLLLRDVGGWLLLRGPRRALVPLLLGPLRELAVLLVWARAPFKRHVSWRGHRVRLGMGTLLYRGLVRGRVRPGRTGAI